MQMLLTRGLFYLSLVATLFMALGLAAGYTIEGSEDLLWPCVALAMVVAGFVMFAAIQVWPSFLRVDTGGTGRFLGRSAIWTLVAYIAGAVAIVGLAYLLMPHNYLKTEAALSAFILALFLPLWFAP